MKTWVVFVVIGVAGCAGSRAPTDQAPEPANRPDSLEVPPVIPEPVAVLPDVAVTPSSRRDSLRAAALLAAGIKARDVFSDTALAVDRLHRAISADSTNLDAYWELGRTYQEMHEYDAALAAWQNLRSIDPADQRSAQLVPIVEMRRDRAHAFTMPASLSSGIPVETEPRGGGALRWAAVGDIQMGEGWPPERIRLPPNQARDMFAQIAEVMADADITFGNLETALADSGESTKCSRGSRNCYAFRAPTDFAVTLKDIGLDVVSANNNHAGDFGDYGRRSTAAALDSAGLHHSGPATGVASWETNGLRIALLAFGTGDGPYLVTDIEGARRAVIEADRNNDLVVVSFHGGAEGSTADRVPRDTEIAYGEDRGDVFAFSRSVIDAGADLVFGHGPHVLRGMEVYRGRLIAYSLGNFSAWHGFNLSGPLGISVVLDATIAINGVVTEAALHSVVLEPPGVPVPDAEGRAIEIVRKLSLLDFGSELFDEHGRFVRR